jgi:PAS domain S-box-containing protein
MNRSAETMTGWKEVEARGKTVGEVFCIIQAKTRASLENPVEHAIRSNAAVDLANDTLLIARNGAERAIDDSATPIWDETGKIVGAVMVFRDVSKRKKLEMALQERIKELNCLRSIADLIEHVDPMEELLQKIADVIPSGWRYPEITCVRITFGKQEFKTANFQETPWVLSSDIIVNGMQAGIVDVRYLKEVSDIDEGPSSKEERELIDMITERLGRVIERKQAEVELERKNAELIEMSKIKSDFVSMVSHELRTPLGPIREGAAIILDGLTGQINEQQRDLLVTVRNNADRLNRLVSNVLDFQKLGSGAAKFTVQENDLNEVINEVYNAIVLMTKQKGLDFILELGKDLPRIKFNRDKILQVLTNLVNNAIKFTEKGNIKIKTLKEGNIIHTIVSDTGLGIKGEDIEKLFQSFQRLEVPAGRKIEGTGLGLAICKEIIRLHNGRIWVESEYGEGSSFHFILPIEERRK